MIVQGGLVGPVVRALGSQRDAGGRPGLRGGRLGRQRADHSLPVFVAMLVPAAIGIGLCNATLIALVSNAAGAHEQGRVQGAAGALESLGRTLGPVWGNGVLQRIGEGKAYGSAAGRCCSALPRMTVTVPAARGANRRELGPAVTT